jgi:hypothetical protein
MLTPQQIEAVRKEIGFQPSAPTSSPVAQVARLREAAAQFDAEKEASKGFLERTGEDLKKRGADILDTFKQQGRKEITTPESAVRIAGDVIGGIGDIIGQIASPVIKPVFESIAQTEIGKSAFGALQGGLDSFETWKNSSEENKRLGEFIEGAGNIASILPIGKGVQIGGKAAKTAIKQTARASEMVAPIVEKAAKSAIKTGENVVEYAGTQITGLLPETLQTIIKNPEALTKAEVEGLKRVNLANKFKNTLDKRIEYLNELGKQYEPIRKSSEVVKLPGGFYRDILKKYNLDFSPEGKILQTTESVPLEPGDIASLQRFIDQYGHSGTLSGNAFLNTRKALSNLAGFGDAKTDISNKIAKDLRKELDNIGKKQLPGLAELDAKYAPEVELLSQIKREFLTPDGELKDTAVNRISNLTGKGKDLQLERVKEIFPGIEEDVKILKAIEDIEYASGRTVGAYARGILGTTGVLTGNIAAIIGAVAATPKLIVPLLKKYGRKLVQSDHAINDIIKKISAGKKPSTIESEIIKKTLESVASVIGGVGTAGVIDQLKEESGL